MKITDLRPMMSTEDLHGTIDFYTGILGFTCDEVNEDWGWATLTIDNVAIMIARPNAHVPYEKIGFTGSFYFTTDDVEAMWATKPISARASKISSTECVNLLSTITTAIRSSLGRKSRRNKC